MTDRLSVRDPLSGVAAVIVVIVGGAEAFVEMVNVAVVAPAGTVTEIGTDATDGSAENNRTSVDPGSANARATVPCTEPPPLTDDADSVRDPIVPAAQALAGTASPTAIAAIRAIRARHASLADNRLLLAIAGSRVMISTLRTSLSTAYAST